MAVKLWTKRRKGRTLEQKLDDQVKAITKLRKADATARTAKKKKVGWVEKLKMGVTGQLAKKRHSKAGREYLRSR